MNTRKNSQVGAEQPQPVPGAGPTPAPNGENTGETTSEKVAGFSLKNYTLPTIAAAAGIRQRLSIPVGRPAGFFRTSADPALQHQLAIYEVRAGFDTTRYLLAPDVAESLGRKAKAVLLKVAIRRPNIVTLWPVRIPDTERGRRNEWHRTAYLGHKASETQWINLEVNDSETAYDIIPATANWGEPEWPKEGLEELVLLGFPERIINDLQHVVLREARGEI
jgi:hypothetical protein